MAEPMESNLFDIPDYENTEDEAFPPFPPPLSPGQDDGEGDAVVNGEDTFTMHHSHHQCLWRIA